jgi:hypothetical protein
VSSIVADPQRRAHARDYLERKTSRLTPEQQRHTADQLLPLLIDRLRIADIEEAIDAAVRLAKAHAPRPPITEPVARLARHVDGTLEVHHG